MKRKLYLKMVAVDANANDLPICPLWSQVRSAFSGSSSWGRWIWRGLFNRVLFTLIAGVIVNHWELIFIILVFFWRLWLVRIGTCLEEEALVVDSVAVEAGLAEVRVAVGEGRDHKVYVFKFATVVPHPTHWHPAICHQEVLATVHLCWGHDLPNKVLLKFGITSCQDIQSDPDLK